MGWSGVQASLRGWAEDLGLYLKYSGNSQKCYPLRGCVISFVFQRAPSGCHRGEGLSMAIHVMGFAQDQDYSKCSGNMIQLLLLICWLPFLVDTDGISANEAEGLPRTKGWAASRLLGQAGLSLASFHL